MKQELNAAIRQLHIAKNRVVNALPIVIGRETGYTEQEAYAVEETLRDAMNKLADISEKIK